MCSNSTRKNAPGQGGQTPQSKNVNDWYAIAKIIGVVLVVHACFSEWFFTVEQVDAALPGSELAATFEKTVSDYQELREAQRGFLRTLGLPIP